MHVLQMMMAVGGSAGGKRDMSRSSCARAGKLPGSMGRNLMIHLVFLVVVSKI